MRALDSSLRFPRLIHSCNTPRKLFTEPVLNVEPRHGSRSNSAAPQLSLHTTGTPHIRASFTTAPQPSYLLGSRSKSVRSSRLPIILLLTASWNRIRLATPLSIRCPFPALQIRSIPDCVKLPVQIRVVPPTARIAVTTSFLPMNCPRYKTRNDSVSFQIAGVYPMPELVFPSHT